MVINEKIKLKTIIPCKHVYRHGIFQNNTCVEVFRHMEFFDFPSYPRNFSILLLMDALKGSYSLSINIVDENGSKIVVGKISDIDVPEDRFINIVSNFQNIIFQREGKYFFQLT